MNVATQEPNLHPQLERVRVEQWARRTLVPAMALSLVVHACLILLAALVLVQGGGGSPGSSEGDAALGQVELAVMTEGEVAALDAAAADRPTAIPSIPNQLSETTLPDIPGTPETVLDEAASSGASQLSDLGSLAGGGELGSGEGLGLGGSGSGGGGGGTSFFGVEATGTRFAFLVDVSSSMDGRRMVNLQEQLVKSINSMGQNCSFFIVAFSTGAQIVGDKKEWRDATESGKRWAKTQIDRKSVV
jgi:hypothetical protein